MFTGHDGHWLPEGGFHLVTDSGTGGAPSGTVLGTVPGGRASLRRSDWYVYWSAGIPPAMTRARLLNGPHRLGRDGDPLRRGTGTAGFEEIVLASKHWVRFLGRIGGDKFSAGMAGAGSGPDGAPPLRRETGVGFGHGRA